MLLTRMRRAMREDEAGQALVVGALAMLVLALAVMATLQLGWAIEQRIQVQNAADNAAYSTAVVVARSLNFVAWVNRTIVAQYVSAMALQSLASSLSALHLVAGLTADLFQTMSFWLCGMARACQLCCAVCLVGAPPACTCASVLQALYPKLEAAARALRRTTDGVGKIADRLDEALAPVVAALSRSNRWGMFGAQQAVRAMTAEALAEPARDNFQRQLMRETAGPTNRGPVGDRYNAAMTALNAADSYWRLFDRDGSERIPEGGTWYGADRSEKNDGAGVKRAERLMAELANASRTGTGASGPTWESGHGLVDKGVVVTNLAQHAGIDLQGASRLVNPMPMDVFCEGDCGGKAAAAPKGPPAPGAGAASEWDGDRNYVFMSYLNHVQMTRGSALASAEYVEASFVGLSYLSGGGGARIVGIQAAHDSADRFHCRYDGRELFTAAPTCPQYAWTRPIKCTREEHHAFEGISRYLSLEVEDSPERAFGQPDFYAFVNKTPQDAGFPLREGVAGFDGRALTARGGGKDGKLQLAGPGAPGLPGLNGWARSQCYYHRPGHWTEPPNLFNPYWRARLAPLAPRADVLARGLPGAFNAVRGLAGRGMLH